MRYVWRQRIERRLLNPSSGQCVLALTMAARRGDVEIATETFRILSSRATNFESHHYELLLEAYINFGDIKTALTITCIMDENGINVKPSSTVSLAAYLRKSDERIQEALAFLQEIKEDRTIPAHTYNCLIAACIGRSDLAGAIALYKKLHHVCEGGPDIETFNSLLQGCRQAKRKDTAMFLAAELVALKRVPNRLTYDTLLLVCLQQSDYEDAFKYYREMIDLKFVPSRATFVAMVLRCAEEGDQRAWTLLTKMKEVGLDTTNMSRWVTAKWAGGVASPGEGKAEHVDA